MKPEVIMFKRIDCPVCFRLEQLLADLCIRKGLEFTPIEVGSGPGSLIDRYRFFADNLRGGGEDVPVVLVGEEKWYIPARTTRGGRRSEGLTKEAIDEACLNLVKKLEEDLGEREAVFPPTHEQMRMGARLWHPSTS